LSSETAEAPAAPTQKKTIKIKRPEGVAQAARTLTIARPEEEPATPAAVKAETEAQGPGVVFSIAAVIAAVIVCVLIYVLAVQAFQILVFLFRDG